MSNNAYTDHLNQRIMIIEQELIDLKTLIQKYIEELIDLKEKQSDSADQRDPRCTKCKLVLNRDNIHYEYKDYCEDCVHICLKCDTLIEDYNTHPKLKNYCSDCVCHDCDKRPKYTGNYCDRC